MSAIDEVLQQSLTTLAGMGDKIFLYGLGGTGKSICAMSALKILQKHPNLKIRILITETNALASIQKGLEIHKIQLKPGQLGYYRPSYKVKGGFSKQKSKLVSSFLDVTTTEALKKKPGANRSTSSNFLRTYDALSKFSAIDVLTGESLNDGAVDTWGLDYLLILDSLTGLIEQLIETVKGEGFLPSQETYGRVQSVLQEAVLTPLTQQAACHLLMLCHPKVTPDPRIRQKKPGPREEDTRIYVTLPKTYGAALDGTFNSQASDVCYAYNIKDKFYLTNNRDGILTVSRKIPLSDKIIPDLSLYDVFKPQKGEGKSET